MEMANGEWQWNRKQERERIKRQFHEACATPI